MSIIQLETQDEMFACDVINSLYEQARAGKVSARNKLKKLYDDDWDTIKERMEVEGSVWYVWFMDGVSALLEGFYKNNN